MTGVRGDGPMRPVHAALLAVLVVMAGCTSSQPPGGTGTDATDGDDGPDPPGRNGDGPRPAAPTGPAVFAIVEELMHRPDGSTWLRIPGTDGNLEQARYLRDRIARSGFDARLQHFNATLPLTGETWCRNVVADRPGDSPQTLILAAHFDSRLLADKDPDPDRRDEPVPGANDGASGVAVVLAIAEVLPETRHSVRVYFFDCEDQGDNTGGWAVGARHAADQLTSEAAGSVTAMVLFDLVGDTNLTIPREGYSHGAAPGLVDAAMGLADRLGLTVFQNETHIRVIDDHVPFLQRGVPAVDLIHLDRSEDGDPFPATHHTTFDDLDHLSAENLGQVAMLGYELTLHLDGWDPN